MGRNKKVFQRNRCENLGISNRSHHILNEFWSSAELIEATAALQYLVMTIVEEPIKIEREKDLRAERSKLIQNIVIAENGPYLVTNIESLRNWLGGGIV